MNGSAAPAAKNSSRATEPVTAAATALRISSACLALRATTARELPGRLNA